jgi:hypothetical protein
MNPQTRSLIDAIHRTPRKYVLAVTGGGTGAVAHLLSVPGGSRTILEANVPYHEKALVEFLGHRPAQFCSAATGRALARRAYDRAAWLAPGEAVLGVGCTASLATDRPKLGDHRFHVTCHDARQITTYSLILRKNARSREQEEVILDSVLLNGLAAACGVSDRVLVELFSDETVHVQTQAPGEPIASLLLGAIPMCCALTDGRLSRDPPLPKALISGAFNPVHEGHWGLAGAASRLLNTPVVFELSVTNVDKPALPAAEIRQRLQQFTWRNSVWLTQTPKFVDKAALFPQAVFVVGADTAERIVAARYYEDSELRVTEALEQIRRQGCHFLVACRQDRAGKPIGLNNLCLPDSHRDLFSEIPKTLFFEPVSSTALRERSAKAATSPCAGGESVTNISAG